MSIATDLKLLACAGTLGAALAAAPTAQAQVPVIDGAAVAQAAKTATAAAEEVQHLTSMLQEVQGIMRTVGQEGLPTVILREGLDQLGGLSGFEAPIRDLVDGGQAVWGAAKDGMAVYNSLQDILGEARRLKGQAQAMAVAPDFSSVSSAHAWISQELTVARDASATTVALTRKARQALAGEAAMNAYALALSARQSVSKAAQRTEALAIQASGTNTLRADMAANTAVMLAMHDQMVQIQALLASVLEVRAADQMATSEPFTPSAASN